MSAPVARHYRLALQPGLSLFEALVMPLKLAGVRSAFMTILAGSFKRLKYCVAPPDPERRSIVAYSQPREAGESYLLFGNATLGLGMDGKPLIHCHGAIQTESGAVCGGHIIPESAVVGAFPIPALATAFDTFVLQQALDTETNMLLLRPTTEKTHDQ
ncbi:PCC domain-containing protein [Bosea sp. PAMC 26642]|uniref:PCC domain-containing protein n=1 Tax=Bosea sp. (strain PAMC 26642) TaxID=1792307 RepID=UPI001F184460|nr:DUF296 domain-containing protein [Bosea sp. PAMC 26642]